MVSRTTQRENLNQLHSMKTVQREYSPLHLSLELCLRRRGGRGGLGEGREGGREMRARRRELFMVKLASWDHVHIRLPVL